MDEYTEKTYGQRIADVYDEWYSDLDPDSILTLSELAHGGKALELGIGTGRVAIPLMKHGVGVQGIDVSESMLTKLHAKPGGEQIQVTIGNFVDVAVDGQFSLVYVVFNTFFSLLTQEEQILCFQNVARHLNPDGVFAIEAFVPDMTRFTSGQALRVIHIGDREVQMDVSLHEQETQVISSQHVVFTEMGTKFFPIKIRYVWPSEMDLMARLAGLQLIYRWNDWKKGQFTAGSGKHISVYGHR